MTSRARIPLIVLSVFISFIFVQSLFFKFSDDPETQHIFGILEAWGASLGFPGLFAHTGIFSQYVVGATELVASLLLLAGLALGKPIINALGALISLAVISGAIFFHLFTPLGIVVINNTGEPDGGELFIFACGVWLASAGILWLRREAIMALPVVRRFFPG